MPFTLLGRSILISLSFVKMATSSETSISWEDIFYSALTRYISLGNKIATTYSNLVFYSDFRSPNLEFRRTTNRAMLSSTAYLNVSLSKPFLLYVCECLLVNFHRFVVG